MNNALIIAYSNKQLFYFEKNKQN